MLGMSMSMKVCSPKKKGPPGKWRAFLGADVMRTRSALMGVRTPEADNMAYPAPPINPRSSPRNAPSRSKIEAHKTGRDLTPTAPGRHGKGDNCATELPVMLGSSQGRAGSQPADQIRSAAIAGQRNGYGSRRTPAGPEGGKRGVRAMERSGLVGFSTSYTTCGQSMRRMQ